MTASVTVRVVRNATWLVAAEAVGRIASFAAILHLTRHLEHRDIGTIELGASFFGVLQLVVLGGIDVLATRRASRSAAIRTLAGTFITTTSLTFFAGFALVVLRALFLAPDERAIVLAFAGAAGLVPFGVRFAFQGRERMSVLSIATIISQLGWLAGVVLLVHDPSDLGRTAWIWIGSQAVRTAIQLAAFLRWFGAIRFRLGWRKLKAWFEAALPVSIGRIGAGAIFVVDVLLLASLGDLGQVGLYAVALKIPLFMVGVGNMVQAALFPPVSRVVPAKGPETGGGLLIDLTKLALSLAVPASLALTLARAPLLVTVFGEEWRASSDLFAILIWRAPISAVAGLFRLVIWSAVPRQDAALSAAGLAVAIAAILILTPLFGARGCALGIVIGEAALLLLYLGGSMPWLRFTLWGHGAWMIRFALGIGVVIAFAWYAGPARSPVVAIAGAVAASAFSGLLINYDRIRQIRGTATGIS